VTFSGCEASKIQNLLVISRFEVQDSNPEQISVHLKKSRIKKNTYEKNKPHTDAAGNHVCQYPHADGSSRY
jgi:hypothetical protein